MLNNPLSQPPPIIIENNGASIPWQLDQYAKTSAGSLFSHPLRFISGLRQRGAFTTVRGTAERIKRVLDFLPDKLNRA